MAIDTKHGIIGRLNGIVNFIENPCNEPWMVYVEAAQPWANKAAMSLLGVDVMQTVRTSTSPGGLRGDRHMRRGNDADEIKSAKPPGIPDPYEYIGHIIKKKTGGFITANATWGTKAIWSLTNIVERGMWEYMLFDLSTDFLYHSLADARRSEYCNRTRQGDCLRSGPWGNVGAFGWQGVGMTHGFKYDSPHCASTTDGCQSEAVTWGTLSLTCSLTGVATSFGSIVIIGMQIVNFFTGEVLAQTGPEAVPAPYAVEYVLSASAPAPASLMCRIYILDGGIGGEMILMGTLNGGEDAANTKKPPKDWPPRPKKPKRRRNNVYTTSDGSEVIQLYNTQFINPPKKPKP